MIQKEHFKNIRKKNYKTYFTNDIIKSTTNLQLYLVKLLNDIFVKYK